MHISTPWETGEGDRAHSQPWVEKIKMTSHLHRSPTPTPHYPCHLSFKRWITGFHLLFQTLGARLSLKSVTLTKGHRVNSCASGVCRSAPRSPQQHRFYSLIETDDSQSVSSQVGQWPDTNMSAFVLGFQKCAASTCGKAGVLTVRDSSKSPRIESSQHCNLHVGATTISVHSTGSEGLENSLNRYK